jgi:hypothetical protein
MIDLTGDGNPFALQPMTAAQLRRRALRRPAWQHPNRLHESHGRYHNSGESKPPTKKKKKKRKKPSTKKKKKITEKAMKKLKSMR